MNAARVITIHEYRQVRARFVIFLAPGSYELHWLDLGRVWTVSSEHLRFMFVSVSSLFFFVWFRAAD